MCLLFVGLRVSTGCCPQHRFCICKYTKKIKRSKERFVVVQCNPQPIAIRLYKMLIDIGLRRSQMWQNYQPYSGKTQQTALGCQNGSRSKCVKMKNESAVKGLYNIYIKNIYLYRSFRDIRKRKWHILTLTHFDTLTSKWRMNEFLRKVFIANERFQKKCSLRMNDFKKSIHCEWTIFV